APHVTVRHELLPRRARRHLQDIGQTLPHPITIVLTQHGQPTSAVGQSRRFAAGRLLPVYPEKQTFAVSEGMSPKGQSRTWGGAQNLRSALPHTTLWRRGLRLPQDLFRLIASTAPDCEFRQNRRLGRPDNSTAFTTSPFGRLTRVPDVT